MVAVAAVYDANDKGASPNDAIVREANERWRACKDWQGVSDERSREDIKFANADARNAWQWPTKIYQARTDANDMPCLTINNTRVHNDLIINSLSKNRFGIKVRPTAGKASYKSAELINTLIRRTQDISKASALFRKIAEQQVDGGIGYLLLETRYISEKSFDQDIYFKASRDPTGVYLDPWITEPDGSDANFGFVFERMSRTEFNRKYPNWKNRVGSSPLGSEFQDWLTDKEIMLVKYYKKDQTEDTLVSFKDENGEDVEMLASEIREKSGSEIYKALMKQIKDNTLDGKYRKVFNSQVKWYLIAGSIVIEKGDWAGKYIPICRCVGREVVIDATLDRKGHTRPLIDAQRMLNFSASTDVQVNALQPKSPWLASSRAIEGQEQWKTANVDNFAVLVYNDVDDEAPEGMQEIKPPSRIDPPRGNPAYQTAMQNAERQMMMISGQYQAQMGQNDGQSASSGKAIGQRQQQGDTATYHFPEHFSDMLRFAGMQLIDLYPKIYDTKRTLHIIGDDGEKQWIQIDPNQTDAIQEMEELRDDAGAVGISFNPGIGEYEVISDPGPDYATQRQEAWDAMSIILTQNSELAAVIGDLLFKYGDFPGADKIQERLQKEIKALKPYLFDDNAQPQLQQAQQQLQRLMQMNADLVQKLALAKLALKGKDEKRDIEAFRASTERLKMEIDYMVKVSLTPQQRAQMQHEIELASHQSILSMIETANEPDIEPDSTSS